MIGLSKILHFFEDRRLSLYLLDLFGLDWPFIGRFSIRYHVSQSPHLLTSIMIGLYLIGPNLCVDDRMFLHFMSDIRALISESIDFSDCLQVRSRSSDVLRLVLEYFQIGLRHRNHRINLILPLDEHHPDVFVLLAEQSPPMAAVRHPIVDY